MLVEGLLSYHPPGDPMIQEKPRIQVVREIDPEGKTRLFYNEEFHLPGQLLILSISAGLALALPEIDLFIRYAQYFTDHRDAGLQPGIMFFIGHSMTSTVFRQIDLVLIEFDTEREFRQVVIVYPVAGNGLTPGQFGGMTEHLDQPVPEHL